MAKKYLGEENTQTFAKGKSRERRFFRAFLYRRLYGDEVPEWFSHVRKAKKYEDERGYDAIIYSTSGDKYLVNIKSSASGVAKFQIRQQSGERSKKILLVPVGGFLDHGTHIRNRVFQAISQRKKTSKRADG